MTTFGDDILQEIKDRVNLVELISGYLSLKKAGRNHLGLCPFHQEKTPSFNVNAERQFFKCFGCGASGDAIEFLMRIEGLSFPEAVRKLAERAGMVLDEKPPTPEEERQRREREHLLRINEVACAWYQQQLLAAPDGKVAQGYLKRRGFDRALAERFRLGWAPDAWEGLVRHLAEKGFEPAAIRQLGLSREGKEGRGDYDLFRGRLIVPIVGQSGQVEAFGGRVLDDSLPKYINSPESPVYHKSRTLYGLYAGRQEMRLKGEAIVVEGYFDQMALVRAGYAHAVATCGTALTDEHARLLRRYATRVLLLFDQDKAGREASFRSMEPLLGAGLEVRLVDLEPGEDPDSFLQKRGPAAFADRLAASRPVLESFCDHVLAAEEGSVEGRVRAARQVLEKVRLLPDPLERDLYLKEIARRTGVESELLRQQARQAPAAGRRETPPPPPEPPPGLPPEDGALPPWLPSAEGRSRSPRSAAVPRRAHSAAPAVPWTKAELLLVALLLHSSLARQAVADEGVENFVLADEARQLTFGLLAWPQGIDRLDPAALEPEVPEMVRPLLQQAAALDPALVTEDPRRILQDCRQGVARERTRRRRSAILAELERGDLVAERRAELLRELTALKK